MSSLGLPGLGMNRMTTRPDKATAQQCQHIHCTVVLCPLWTTSPTKVMIHDNAVLWISICFKSSFY